MFQEIKTQLRQKHDKLKHHGIAKLQNHEKLTYADYEIVEDCALIELYITRIEQMEAQLFLLSKKYPGVL